MATTNLNSLCDKLNYKFRNIILLHEALTHDFEETEENKYFSPFPGVLSKQKKNGRLHTLGNRLFQLLCVEQAVKKFGSEELESVAVQAVPNKGRAKTDLCSFLADFQKSLSFEAVGEKLSLSEFFKTTDEFRGKVGALYEPVIKAILGAIFIDCGGCYGLLESKANPLRETRNVFLELWGLGDFDEKETLQLFQEAQMSKCQGFWDKMGMADNPGVGSYYSKLNYKFQRKWILKEALTEKGFEIFGAVGGAVWELVVCEYFFWFFVNDEKQTHFNEETLDLYSKAEFQREIAKAVGLEYGFIPETRAKAGGRGEIQNRLKCLVGAVYLDSGCSLASAKKSIVHLFEKYRTQIARSGHRVLPYSMKTYRGTYFHTVDKHSGIVDHGPPRRQDPIQVLNVAEFMKSTSFCEYEIERRHADQLAVARREEEKDHKRIFTCSEDRCNQLEFERLGLYRTLQRIRSDFTFPNGDIFNSAHTYGKCLCKSDEVTADCTGVPETRQEKVECRVASNEEVLAALEVLSVWMLLWEKFICKNVKLILGILFQIYIVLFYGTLMILVFCMLMKKSYEGVVWLGSQIISGHPMNTTG